MIHKGVAVEIYICDDLLKEWCKLGTRIEHRFFHLFKLLKAGEILSRKFFKKLKGYELWEFRVREKDSIYRAIGAFNGNRFIVLSVFKKKTQKIPKQEIEKVMRRLKYY